MSTGEPERQDGMSLRQTNLEKLADGVFDVVIIGGGINGAVSAAALSARGARVALIDRGDFAAFTSQSSSNLAWGGIKYLESFELRLVRKLCRSRNHLIRAYPSTVQEIRFFTTIEKGFRFAPWLLFLGTVLYWLMGSFFTRAPRLLSRRRMATLEPVVEVRNARGGIEYSDAYLHDNDARFVFGFIRSALNYGCIAANYVESRGASRGEDGIWTIEARDVMSDETIPIRGRLLINACGPFVDEHNAWTGQKTSHRHVFSKGIHLIVDRLTASRRVLTFFADDGRLFFAIPMGARTVVGTTDTRVADPVTVVTADDRRFVLDNLNKRLRLPRPLTEADVIAERCGVRPLVVDAADGADRGDWTKLSRKHAIDVNEADRHISIYGGKLTDCINVGEEICEDVRRLGIDLPHPRRTWYGEPSAAVRDEYFHQAELLSLDELTAPYASERLSTRLWRRYGALAFAMLEDIRRDPRMGEILIETSEYIRCEITQAAKHEMIVRLDDFLRRRSKISQVVRHEALRRSPGLKQACRILFGADARARWEEYFGEPWNTSQG
jgi:glycerol-3-phosphate dehydrogenase